MKQQAKGLICRFGAFVRECGQRIRVMKVAFDQAESGDGARCRERSEEQRRDEHAWSRTDDAGRPNDHPRNLPRDITRLRSVLLIIVSLAALPLLARAQSLTDSDISSGAVVSTAPVQLDVTYTRPTQTTKLRNYFFDAFGPYPIVGAAAMAGIDQYLM
jgi:hypothetical protein